MAIIKCPECSNEISDKAKACIHCGCPLEEFQSSGPVRIKMPNNIIKGIIGLWESRRAAVSDKMGKLLWEGQHGENATFVIDEPTEIVIDLGSLANNVKCTVYPNKKYSLVQDMGIHWNYTYRITEVDVIDSE